jgi:hypothetical protein
MVLGYTVVKRLWLINLINFMEMYSILLIKLVRIYVRNLRFWFLRKSEAVFKEIIFSKIVAINKSKFQKKT